MCWWALYAALRRMLGQSPRQTGLPIEELARTGMASLMERIREAGIEGEVCGIRWIGGSDVSDDEELVRLRELVEAGRIDELSEPPCNFAEGSCAAFYVIETKEGQQHLLGLYDLEGIWFSEDTLAVKQIDGPVDNYPDVLSELNL